MTQYPYMSHIEIVKVSCIYSVCVPFHFWSWHNVFITLFTVLLFRCEYYFTWKHRIYLNLTEYSHVTHLSAQFSKERQQISYICMYFVFVPFHFDPWHNIINTHLTDECTQMKYFTMITNKGWNSTKLSHITHWSGYFNHYIYETFFLRHFFHLMFHNNNMNFFFSHISIVVLISGLKKLNI